MKAWVERLTQRERETLKTSRLPRWISPMQATLTDKRFSDDDWIYERKFDGERLVGFRGGETIRLMTRNRNDVSETYPEVIEGLARQSIDNFVVDGEVIAFKGRSSSFSRLQQRMQLRSAEDARRQDVAVYFYMFDLPYLDGYRLDALPLRTRKKLLRSLFRFEEPIRFTPHRNGEGESLFTQACKKGWEGIIAKRAASPYVHSRSRDWLKFKCSKGQELVIGGFTEPKGERAGFGALLVGYFDDEGNFWYAGKVGTGYDNDFLTHFRDRLDRISTKDSPFSNAPSSDNVTWVRPRYVGEFGFTEWTSDGKLRHPRFVGLRRDKKPGDVTREEPDD